MSIISPDDVYKYIRLLGKPAERYNFWSTPEQALDEFGIGISLYFKTLKVLFVVLLSCALINLVAVYENKKFNLNANEAEALNALTGNQYNLKATATYLLGSVYGAERNDLKLAKQVAADIAVRLEIKSLITRYVL